METFLSSPILQTLAAIWLGAGIVKGFVAASQMPSLISWVMFYKTNDVEEAADWYKSTGLLVCCALMMVGAVIIWGTVGPLLVFREGARNFFTPYGDPFLADVAATYMKIDTGVTPGEFETWDQYQVRIGDDPKKVAEAIMIAQPKLPEPIKKVLDDAHTLRNMDREEIDVAEDEEFRDR